MNKINILPANLISKIAAGEVIERPASVVKELVENSLDAGADSIEVDLSDAGKTLIRIRDNGHGISARDLDNLFLRHATSKISAAEDLRNIMSMGFRGEALYSIAAISDIILRTMSKQDGDGGGTEMHLRGGDKIDLKPRALSGPGTEIEVKELFFNTPARRKFMKSNTSEMNQVLNLFVPYTLLCPAARFRLGHKGRDLIDLSPASTGGDGYVDRAAQVLNLDSKDIQHAHRAFPAAGGSIRLLLGGINIQRSRRDMQYIFVNNRPVQNKSIGYHMNRVYKLIMSEEYYPFFAVFVNIPPDEVDVNIHPAKREVRIRDERGLCGILREITEVELMGGAARELRKAGTQAPAPSSDGRPVHFADLRASRPCGPGKTRTPFETIPAAQQSFFVPTDTPAPSASESLSGQLTAAKYIGQFMNKYLLFETERSLLLMDQHAAAERVTFERLIRQMGKGSLEVQPLLSPALVTVTVQQRLAWEELKHKLKDLGFDTNLFDETTVAVQSYPVLIKDPARAVENILAGEEVFTCDMDTLARRACRGSVMTGDRLSSQEADSLRDQLNGCFDPFTCPHGRPTVVEISEDFLQKNFFRK